MNFFRYLWNRFYHRQEQKKEIADGYKKFAWFRSGEG